MREQNKSKRLNNIGDINGATNDSSVERNRPEHSSLTKFSSGTNIDRSEGDRTTKTLTNSIRCDQKKCESNGSKRKREEQEEDEEKTDHDDGEVDNPNESKTLNLMSVDKRDQIERRKEKNRKREQHRRDNMPMDEKARVREANRVRERNRRQNMPLDQQARVRERNRIRSRERRLRLKQQQGNNNKLYLREAKTNSQGKRQAGGRASVAAPRFSRPGTPPYVLI